METIDQLRRLYRGGDETGPTDGLRPQPLRESPMMSDAFDPMPNLSSAADDFRRNLAVAPEYDVDRYLFTGAEYFETSAYVVSNTGPTSGFDGWVGCADANSYGGPNTVTACAGCAPASM
jgi:hypothetical protein